VECVQNCPLGALARLGVRVRETGGYQSLVPAQTKIGKCKSTEQTGLSGLAHWWERGGAPAVVIGNAFLKLLPAEMRKQ
jgi:hypothetical protein